MITSYENQYAKSFFCTRLETRRTQATRRVERVGELSQPMTKRLWKGAACILYSLGHHLPVRHGAIRLVRLAGIADRGVQLRPFLTLVLGLEQMPNGAEAVGYPPDLQDEATRTVLEQAEVLCRDWTS